MLIDTHCHLNDPSFAGRLPEVIARAREAGIGACIVPAYDRASLPRTAELARQYPHFIAPAYGLHPWFLGQGMDIDALRQYLVQPGTVAVGEVGLDFSPECPPPEAQLEPFGTQLDLAAELGLPVLIHCRKAHDELLKVLTRYKGKLRGVLHSFSGGRDMALRFIELGFHIAFSGSVTRTTAKKYHKTAAGIPLDFLLVETDAPSIATQATPASQVEPLHTAEVARAIAGLRGSTFEEIAQATTGNAGRLFNLNIIPNAGNDRDRSLQTQGRGLSPPAGGHKARPFNEDKNF
ncbi:MAG: TatD family hydrolase [Deltaproteobacteria bacterium]|nr:TatD family hydrolase [Deltaproteobacteria bacterium]